VLFEGGWHELDHGRLLVSIQLSQLSLDGRSPMFGSR